MPGFLRRLFAEGAFAHALRGFWLIIWLPAIDDCRI
jgi:hypothetical protein